MSLKFILARNMRVEYLFINIICLSGPAHLSFINFFSICQNVFLKTGFQ